VDAVGREQPSERHLHSVAHGELLQLGVGELDGQTPSAVEINDRTARNLQAASVAMLQMTTEVRRCQACQVYSDHVDLITFDGHNYSYQYVPASKQLQFVNKDVTPNVNRVLAYTPFVTSGGGQTSYPCLRVEPGAVRCVAVYHFLLVTVAPGSVTVRAIRTSGDELDRFVIKVPAG